MKKQNFRRLSRFPSVLLAISLHQEGYSQIKLNDLVLEEEGSLLLSFQANEGFYYYLQESRELSESGWNTIAIENPVSLESSFGLTGFLTGDNAPKRSFFRLVEKAKNLPGDLDGDLIDDLYELQFSDFLNPLDPGDAATDPDGAGSSLLDRYLTEIAANPPVSTSNASPGTLTSSLGPLVSVDLDDLLEVEGISGAGSDYTPGTDVFGGLDMDGELAFLGISLSNPTAAGVQYPGTYYFGLKDTSIEGSGGFYFFPEEVYRVDCQTREIFQVKQYTNDPPLYYKQEPGGEIDFRTFDFGESPEENGYQPATWEVRFPNLPFPFSVDDAGPCFVKNDELLEFSDLDEGEVVPVDDLFPAFEYREKTMISLEEDFNLRIGFSPIPLDHAPATSHLDAVRDLEDPPSYIIEVETGFVCDGLTLDPVWPGDQEKPTITGNVEDCRRVYVALSSLQSGFDSLPVVNSYPLLDGSPHFVLLPADASASMNLEATVLTSQLDPRRFVKNPDGGDDLPLQDLSSENSNSFGMIEIPQSGVTILDASLLTDELSYTDLHAPLEDQLVGLPDEGGQLGTYQVETTTPEAIRVSGFGASTMAGQILPWVRDKVSDRDVALVTNQATGARAVEFLRTSGASIEAHSFEFVQSGPSLGEDAEPEVKMTNCHYRAMGGVVVEPLDHSEYSTDPEGRDLGFFHLSALDGRVCFSASSIVAKKSICFVSRELQVSQGSQQSEEANLIVQASKVSLLKDASFAAKGQLWFYGGPETGNVDNAFRVDGSDPADAMSKAVLQAEGEIRVNGFEALAITSAELTAPRILILGEQVGGDTMSELKDMTITADQVARIYTNHHLSFEGENTIANGQLASLTVEVKEGSVLELSGENVGVHANSHLYGSPGYGRLLINGVEQDGSSRLPNFHLRPGLEQ